MSETPEATTQSPRPTKTCWPILNYRDARAGIAFLVSAFGFVESIVVPGEDGTSVVHAELLWPEGGGIMCGSANPEGTEFEKVPPGVASVYVVTDSPDELFERATAAGAELVRELRDEEYGSRGFSVRDPEGNVWSFGTYPGEPVPS